MANEKGAIETLEENRDQPQQTEDDDEPVAHTAHSLSLPSATAAASPLIFAQTRSSDDRNAAADESVPFIDKENVDGAERRQLPSDWLNLVYLITLLHGMGMLLPWNTFLTIGSDYFVDYKLRNVSVHESYKAKFFGYMTICAQIPNLLLNFLNLFVVISGGLHRRIYFSLGVVITLCLVTILMIFVNTDDWPFGFFIFTMLTVVLLNSANGIYQNSIWGLVADFPGKFTNAIVVGNNLCGILMVVIYILIIVVVGAEPKLGAFLYFLLALLTVLGCIVSFHVLPKLEFYKYYVNKAAKARVQLNTDILHEAEDIDEEEATVPRKSSKSHPSYATYIAIFKESWRQLFDVWLVFFVTLSLFPTVLLDVNLYPPGREIEPFFRDSEDISKKLYRQLTVFLNFNLFATIGSWFADRFHWPSPKFLTLPIALRLLFLPLFWSCNYSPSGDTRTLVLIKSEWFFIVLITIMALTHGYWSSLAMIYAPKQVDESKAQVVGMMSGFFLVLGIASGISFTFLEPQLAYLLEAFFNLF